MEELAGGLAEVEASMKAARAAGGTVVVERLLAAKRPSSIPRTAARPAQPRDRPSSPTF